MSPAATATRTRTASPRAKSGKAPSRPASSGAPAWLRWWPLAVGILLACFVERAAAIVAITGVGARFFLPLPYLVEGHSFGLAASFAENVSEFATFAQFPLYGLLLVMLAAHLRFWKALGVLFALHVAAFMAVVYLLHV